jgi:hypothetical protein
LHFIACFQGYAEFRCAARLASRLVLRHRRENVLCDLDHVDLTVHDDIGHPVRLVDQPAQAVAVDALDDDLGKLLGSEDGFSPEGPRGCGCRSIVRSACVDLFGGAPGEKFGWCRSLNTLLSPGVSSTLP